MKLVQQLKQKNAYYSIAILLEQPEKAIEQITHQFHTSLNEKRLNFQQYNPGELADFTVRVDDDSLLHTLVKSDPIRNNIETHCYLGIQLPEDKIRAAHILTSHINNSISGAKLNFKYVHDRTYLHMELVAHFSKYLLPKNSLSQDVYNTMELTGYLKTPFMELATSDTDPVFIAADFMRQQLIRDTETAG